MGVVATVILAVVLIIIGLFAIYSLKRPSSRYRLKRDFGLTDRQIDQRFGTSTVDEDDLKSLEEEKRSKDRVA